MTPRELVEQLDADWRGRKEPFDHEVRAWTGADSEVGRFLTSLLARDDL